MNLIEFFTTLPSVLRVVLFALLAVLGHFLVRGLQRLSAWIFTPKGAQQEAFVLRFPKLATVITILVSALTFTFYFAAFGLIMNEVTGIKLTTYLASASIIGLAVGFGSQGLVQDVVIGLTLIFTDVLDVGDMVELSGQVGRVERIGLRFTTLVNFLGQTVYVPNRNIMLISRYRGGFIRAYVDIQIPEKPDDVQVAEIVEPIAQGMHVQYSAAVPTEPEVFGVSEAQPGGWRYLRIKFRLWPGQQALIETVFKQRVLAALKSRSPEYADWMISVTYRVD